MCVYVCVCVCVHICDVCICACDVVTQSGLILQREVLSSPDMKLVCLFRWSFRTN